MPPGSPFEPTGYLMQSLKAKSLKSVAMLITWSLTASQVAWSGQLPSQDPVDYDEVRAERMAHTRCYGASTHGAAARSARISALSARTRPAGIARLPVVQTGGATVIGMCVAS